MNNKCNFYGKRIPMCMKKSEVAVNGWSIFTNFQHERHLISLFISLLYALFQCYRHIYRNKLNERIIMQHECGQIL